MARLEKVLEILKVIGGIAKTMLCGMEEYRKIQETKAYRENQKKKVKYLPKPKKRYKRNK